MKFAYFKVTEETVDISFDIIFNYLVKENNGEFVDSFSDNIEYYMKEIYDVDLKQSDFDDVSANNDYLSEEIFKEWQKYLEEKELN